MVLADEAVLWTLTEAHRRGQARIGAETVQMMTATWPQLNPAQIEATIDRWLASAERIIVSQFNRSASLAAQYGSLHGALAHQMEISGAQDLVKAAESIAAEEILPSLLATGPGTLRTSFFRGDSVEVASRKGMAASARSGQRLALTGSRRTLLPVGIGYRRATSGKPCAFCATLAARGAVYNSRESASFKAHDGCNCHPEPIYNRHTIKAPETKRFEEIYSEAQAKRKAGEITAGGSNPALNAMRTHMRNLGLL